MKERELVDAELVERYARGREESAFAEITRRHGPMVYASCRRLLGDCGAADDAVQAVFMLLARKAGSLSRKEALAGWLHGAARLVAREGMRAARRRRRAEQEAAGMRATHQAGDSPDWDSIRGEIDAEIGRLPRHYRDAVLLSCVEGRSETEIARELGVPAGTVKSRVSRGLEKLRERLVRHGRVMGVGALAALLAEHGGLALPPALAARVAATGAGGTAAAGAGLSAAASAQAGTASAVLLMMEGALKAMMMAKLKLAAAVLGAAVVLGTAVPVTRSLVGAAEKTGPAAPPAAARPVTVVVVRPDGSLVLSAGRKQGVSPGSEFRILRGGKVLATVKVTGFDAAGRAVSAPPKPDLKRPGRNWGWGMLCPGCKRKMFTSDIGKCRNCGRGTSSGSFKLCQACARAGGTCQACGAKFAKPVAAPGPAIRVGDLALPRVTEGSIHWGKVVNGLQAGLVPLGSRDVKDWAYSWGCSECKRKGRLGTGKLSACRVCKTRNTGAGFCCKSCALARRVCAGCGRARPSSATFVAGRPMGFELHYRNPGKKAVSLYDAGYVRRPRWSFSSHDGKRSWVAFCITKDDRAAGGVNLHLPPGGTAVEVRSLNGEWRFAERLPGGRRGPENRSLPLGKYVMTATYTWGESTGGKPAPTTRARFWQGEATAGPVEIEIKAGSRENRPAR